VTLQAILQYKFRPNILIIGSERAAESVLDGICPMLDGPIEQCDLPGPLRLPETGALILRYVGALVSEQQSELMQWLDRGPGVPVLSVNASPLFAQVQNGMFNQRLYYRLNTVLEYVDPPVTVN
jgi:hypothetical protein